MLLDQNYQQPGYDQNYQQPGYDQNYQQPGYNQGYQQQQYSYQANPYNYQPQTSNYTYDPYKIYYQDMSVQQWSSIPNDQSQYSCYWDNQAAFEPQKFQENTKKETKWNDLGFTIAFWINFVVVIGLFIFIATRPDPQPSGQGNQTNSSIILLSTNSSGSSSIANDISSILGKTIAVGFAVALVVNIIHFAYATFASKVYINAGFFIGVVFALILIIYPMIFYKIYAMLVFPAFILIISLILWCIYRETIPMSAAVMKQTGLLICQYPSVILSVIIQSIVDTIVTVVFTLFVYFVLIKGFSVYVYIYVVFAFYWISYTFGYVIYMTGSGLGSTWYFLNGTEYFPKNPVWESFKRAWTTSFGSASCAGFWLALIEILELIIKMDTNSDSGAAQIAILIIKCIALCILACIKACFKFIARYALIYCATFGIPFKEGCRRFTELKCNRFIDVMLEGSCINACLTFNFVVFVIGACLLGYGIGDAMAGSSGAVFVCIFTLLFTLAIFLLLEYPFETISDTLFICFAEAPEKLKTSANELYEFIVDNYGKNMKKKLDKQIKKAEKKKK